MLSSDESRAVIANIEYLRGRVGGVWLDDELAAIRDARAGDRSGGRRRNPRHHPLALQFDQVLTQVAEGNQLNVTPALADLSRLAVSVRLLDQAGATGLDERLLRLQGDYDLFESTSFELNVAADFARNGHTVEFLPESTDGDRTPDLVVDNAVEVECKKKFTRTQRDRRNEESWDLISRRIWAAHSAPGTSLRVDLTTDTDPTRADVAWTLQQVSSFMEFEEQTRTVADQSRLLHLARMTPVEHGDSIEVTVPPESPVQRSEGGQIEITCRLEGGRLYHHTSYDFSYRSKAVPDWVASVSSSLKKAKGQFSGDLPALTVVGIPAPARWTGTEDRDRVVKVVESHMTSNSTISAVVLVTDELVETPQGRRPQVTHVHCRNPGARRSLPAAYLVD
jgi:hypothetical protein